MAIDKQVGFQLNRFATAFREARERGSIESDTVMYLIALVGAGGTATIRQLAQALLLQDESELQGYERTIR